MENLDLDVPINSARSARNKQTPKIEMVQKKPKRVEKKKTPKPRNSTVPNNPMSLSLGPEVKRKRTVPEKESLGYLKASTFRERVKLNSERSDRVSNVSSKIVEQPDVEDTESFAVKSIAKLQVMNVDSGSIDSSIKKEDSEPQHDLLGSKARMKGDGYTRKLRVLKSLRSVAYEEGLDGEPEGIAADILTLKDNVYTSTKSTGKLTAKDLAL